MAILMVNGYNLPAGFDGYRAGPSLTTRIQQSMLGAYQEASQPIPGCGSCGGGQLREYVSLDPTPDPTAGGFETQLQTGLTSAAYEKKPIPGIVWGLGAVAIGLLLFAGKK